MSHVTDLIHYIDQLQPLVRRFAQLDLGCACPEEVFDQVQLFWGTLKPAYAELALVVGQRLLICFFPAAPFCHQPAIVLTVVRACVDLRDQHRLNRCRIVIAGQLPEPLARQLSAECTRYDERVHLHLV